jgi:hypothetical protein
MRGTSMSIEMAFGIYLEGMARVAQDAQHWDPGACRRR